MLDNPNLYDAISGKWMYKETVEGKYMDIVVIGKTISYRPSEYDTQVLEDIHSKNPHLTNANDLICHALCIYHMEATYANSKSKRLERIEATQMQILERLLSLENKVERVTTV